MSNKVYIIGSSPISEADRLFLEAKKIDIEVLSNEQSKEVILLSRPKPMPIIASPVVNYIPFIPPLTRAERRKLKRKK
jgi:hypothetical protein